MPDGWCWTRLGCITDVIQYGLSNPAESTGDYRLLRITDIQNGCVNWDIVPFTCTDEPEKYLLHKDDIVFARTGATVGKSFLITDLPYASVYASYLIRIRLINGISANYIYQFFDSYCYWEQVTDKSVGVGQPNCNGTALKELFIPLPSQAEQNRIVQVADNLLKIADVITSERESLSKLIQTTKSKILDLAIRGKLVLQDTNDEPASVLLDRIREEKEELIKLGKIKRNKKESFIFKGDDNSYYRQTGNLIEAISDWELDDIPDNWALCCLGELCDYGNCNNVEADSITKNAWILDLEDIEKDTGRVIKKIRKTERDFTSTKHSFHEGQVLYSKLRPYLNKVIIADEDGFCTSEILPLDFLKIVLPQYTLYYLMSPTFLKYANRCSYGVKMPRLGTADGKKAIFPLPPLEEQYRISDCISKIFMQVDTISASIL
ncbi:MAG: restriction endonuclease subunit S [Eubacterium sp.]|uniref:restriction endonuclease subunit S n=1 Tax=Eubacterium sp. TaxID=142586 RepID=UPI00300F0819